MEKVPECVPRQTVYVSGIYTVDAKLSELLGLTNNRNTFVEPSDFIFIKKLDANAQITDMKSSNPQFKVLRSTGIDAVRIVRGMKPDADYTNLSSTISFKVIQNGKTYKLSCLINTQPFRSPVKSFKIGLEEMAGYYKKGYNCINGPEISGKQKVTIEMAPGYVLESINKTSGGICAPGN